MICESENIENYLAELDEVNYTHPVVKEKIDELFHVDQTELEKINIAFEFVRDEISHSWDIQGKQVTCKASEVLEARHGICYAKSNLLAALLRSQGIPTGFCYQRIIFGVGHSIHALNAVYVSSLDQWVRLDARGNKEGVDAQFSLDEEKLAFTINEALDEKDYSMIYAKPHEKTIGVLTAHDDAVSMCKYYLPESI